MSERGRRQAPEATLADPANAEPNGEPRADLGSAPGAGPRGERPGGFGGAKRAGPGSAPGAEAGEERGGLGGERRSEADGAPERTALFSRLFREHNHSLMRFLVTRLRSVQEARDVAQEAYVRLLQLDRPGAISFLRAYLFRIAANLAVDRLRRRAVRERPDLDPFEELTDEYAPDRQVLAKQEFDIVYATLRELPEKCQRAFALSVIEGRSTAEIAEIMGLKERMVRIYVARALTQCKLRLDDEQGKHDASR